MGSQDVRRLKPVAGDGIEVSCGETLWTEAPGDLPSWFGVPLTVVAYDPVKNVVAFTSPANMDYLETISASLLTHEVRASLSTLKELGRHLLEDPVAACGTTELEDRAAYLDRLLELASTAGGQEGGV